MIIKELEKKIEEELFSYFSIKTIDNPGWRISAVTKNRGNLEINYNLSEEFDIETKDWLWCCKKEDKFNAAGGPLKLLEMLDICIQCLNADEIKSLNILHLVEENYLLNWMQRWYFSHCDGDWEHTSCVEIYLNKNNYWHFEIELEGTEMNFVNFNEINCDSSLLICKVSGTKFIGEGDFSKFGEIIEVFHNWVVEYLGKKC